MSSQGFQLIKRIHKTQLNPQTNGGEEVKSSTIVKKIGSIGTGSKEQVTLTKGTSSMVLGRELN